MLAQNAKAWRVKPQFSGLLDVPEGMESVLRAYLPDFRFDLFQLAEHSFEGLPGTPAGILILRVMKAERLARLLDDWVWDEELMQQISRDLLEVLLRYILATDVDRKAFRSRLHQINDPQTKDSAMTLANQLRQEGTAGAFVRQVKRKFPTIADQVIPVLERLDEEQLLCFGDAILFMQTPEECLEWLAGK